MKEEWSLRALLSPVVTRLLIHGANPIDLEACLSAFESRTWPNAKHLERAWHGHWEAQALLWEDRAAKALCKGARRTAHGQLLHAMSGQLARVLVNGGDIATRRHAYAELARTGRMASELVPVGRVEELTVLIQSGSLEAQLHLPEGEGPFPVCLVLAGLGSCKEEMFPHAQVLAQRGVAALVPDMPGCGQTLLRHGIPCGRSHLEEAVAALIAAAQRHPQLDPQRIGATGLCMGGGYAWRAAALEPSIKACATLFPLFVGLVPMERVPRWMKEGEWVALQTGGLPIEAFLEQMRPVAHERIGVPYLQYHASTDNWMDDQASQELFARADPERSELVRLESSAVLTSHSATTHAMPVGEQMHWVVPEMADWMAARLAKVI